MNNQNPRKNEEGYSNLAAYKALKNIEEDERFHKLLHTIFYICDIAGFKVKGRIVLVDKKTGNVWK